ncbi:MAG: RluA family pseudouridine synthase [Oligosphaeraceae bacterium]
MTPLPQTTLDIDAATAGMRLDLLLVSRHPERSRTAIQRALAAGCATVNGEPGKAGLRLEEGDRLVYALPPEETDAPPRPVPRELPLEILHEDEALLVVNKPAGLVVHPGAGEEGETLVSALLYREPAAFASVGEDALRPGIVHRLDKDTSGVLVVARTQPAWEALKRSFLERQVDKLYLALARGGFKENFAAIEAPVGRDPRHRQRMAVLPQGGRPALTKYRVVGEMYGIALLQVRLYTGRTHQIRVHLSHVGHPVLGDSLYGGDGKRPPLVAPRQMLHAWKVALPHPLTGERMVFTAPPPEDFQRNLAFFAQNYNLEGLAQ